MGDVYPTWVNCKIYFDLQSNFSISFQITLVGQGDPTCEIWTLIVRSLRIWHKKRRFLLKNKANLELILKPHSRSHRRSPQYVLLRVQHLLSETFSPTLMIFEKIRCVILNGTPYILLFHLKVSLSSLRLLAYDMLDNPQPPPYHVNTKIFLKCVHQKSLTYLYNFFHIITKKFCIPEHNHKSCKRVPQLILLGCHSKLFYVLTDGL